MIVPMHRAVCGDGPAEHPHGHLESAAIGLVQAAAQALTIEERQRFAVPERQPD